MSIFDTVKMGKPDPIIDLTIAFNEEPRQEKVNLGVGAYKTAELTPFVLNTMRKAEKALFEAQENKEYLPIDGQKRYCQLILELLIGTERYHQYNTKIYSSQSLGGTGALRVGAEFFKQELGDKIYLPTPTWANHKPLFTRAGLEVEGYPYYDTITQELSFEAMCEALKKVPKGSAILLHVCCQNPTGMDLNLEQWKELSSLMKEYSLFPFFDCAYQGFAVGLEEDAQPVRYFLDQGHEMMIAYSCSKNFGLYGERVGALFVVANDVDAAIRIGTQVKPIIRANYSNPPLSGERLVEVILSSETLKKEWMIELTKMRERITGMRASLVSGLSDKKKDHDFSYLRNQRGMFSYSGLNKVQVERLREEYAIYMPKSGRINVAGLAQKNLEYVIDAVVSVMK